MSIPEYYLHMFCGINGSNDEYSGAGRIAIAALMGGYGLTASNKKDLQTRTGWETTPGCFLGQRELKIDSWSIRNRPSLKLLVKLVEFKKAGRTMNYALNWNEMFDDEIDYNLYSPTWPIIARIYWLGKFMFGRNVIPEFVMEGLRARFTVNRPSRVPNDGNIYNAYVMQFFYDNHFFNSQSDFSNYIEDSYLPVNALEAGSTRLPREKILLSFSFAMNPTENAPGFFAGCAYLPLGMQRGQSFREVPDLFTDLERGRSQIERSSNRPLSNSYYGSNNLGLPSIHVIDASDSRFPGYPRDIIPLLFCKTDMTPEEERSSNFTAIYGQFNGQLIQKNLASYVCSALLYEYHILLAGRELFPLSLLQQARTEKGWTVEEILETPNQLPPLNGRNSTVGRLVKFNLDRQNQV